MVKENLEKFFIYLAQAEDYDLAKELFPWKFDINLSKSSVMNNR